MTPAQHTQALFARYKALGQDIACRTSGAEQDAEPENVGTVVMAMREQYRMLGELLGIRDESQ